MRVYMDFSKIENRILLEQRGTYVVDKILILRKLSTLDEYLKQIGEYASITVHAYADDWKTQRIVERTFQMMIETCLDISGHIISDEKLESAGDVCGCFQDTGGKRYPGQTTSGRL